MKKFMYLYFGGTRPENEEAGKAVMADWMTYLGKMGDTVIDGGAPLEGGMKIGGGSVAGATGYSIIKAENMEEAMALTEGNPHIKHGGTVEVYEIVPVQM
jgi:hypothetical protein